MRFDFAFLHTKTQLSCVIHEPLNNIAESNFPFFCSIFVVFVYGDIIFIDFVFSSIDVYEGHKKRFDVIDTNKTHTRNFIRRILYYKRTRQVKKFNNTRQTIGQDGYIRGKSYYEYSF